MYKKKQNKKTREELNVGSMMQQILHLAAKRERIKCANIFTYVLQSDVSKRFRTSDIESFEKNIHC